MYSENTYNVKKELNKVENEIIKIKEYGFCWVMGNDIPTTINDKREWTVPSTSTTTSYSLEYEIPNLKPYTSYNYCAYAISAEDVYAYEFKESGQIIPNKIIILTKDQIIYSPVMTFKTGAIVDNDNETGDDWGWGDGEDVEIDGKNK